jgi:hypothetical protein
MANINIAEYKRPGVFLEEFNKSLNARPVADVQNYQLVIGSSKRGPFNRPVLITNPGEREQIFGKLDRNLEYKQSFFHRTIDNCTASGPVWAINIMPFEEQDTANWISMSTSSKHYNTEVSAEPISNFYNKTDFWERSEEELLYVANKEVSDQKNILHFVNLGDRKITIFAFKSYIKGFDITAAEWYNGAENVPPFMYPTDLISDYFVQIAAVSGDWTDYANLSTDLTWSKYFVSTGLIKSKFLEFINNPKISLIGYWDVCLIPYFRDKNNKAYFVQDTVNATTDSTGLFASYDTTRLEDTDFPLGFVDLIGNALIDGQEFINFLSYKENILDRILFETKYLSESDADGYLINTSGISSSFDETSTNVWFMPDRRELTAGTNDSIMHKFAMTPQRNIETDLSEMTVVGLYTSLTYTRDYLVGIVGGTTNDVNPAELFNESVPPTRPGETPIYVVPIDISIPERTGANTSLTPDAGALYGINAASEESPYAYSVMNLKRIDIKPFNSNRIGDNYYVINGKKITFDKIINPNNIEDSYKPYITVGPLKPNWRTDVVLPVPTDGTRFSTGMQNPVNGRIDLVCLNDSGHIVIITGAEFTVGATLNTGYVNPIMTTSTAIPVIPNNHICVGYITMGILYTNDASGYKYEHSYVHFYPVQIGPNGPLVDKNVHIKYNTAAERILDSRPVTPGALPMTIKDINSTTNYFLPLDYTGSNPYLAYQEPRPIDGDFLYYTNVNQVEVLFFNTSNNKNRANVKSLFHSSTNNSSEMVVLPNSVLDLEGPNLFVTNYSMTETTAGGYYHNEISRRRYTKLKNRLLTSSGSSIIAQTEKDFNKIKNAGSLQTWRYDQSQSSAELLTSKFDFTSVFYDQNATENAKIQLNLDSSSIMRAGKLTIYFSDYEQIFATKKLTTALSKSGNYYNIKPNALPMVNGSPVNIPTEYQISPLGFNSDIYKKYMDGYINNKDYFYQLMFATDDLYTLRFDIAKDSENIDSYRIYLDRNDGFEIISFEGYGNNLRTQYGNTVLAYTQFNSNDLYQDVIPSIGSKIYIKGTNLNDGFYTVINIGLEIAVQNNTTYQISYIEVQEPVKKESNTKLSGQGTSTPPYVDTYWVNRFRMYSADKVFAEFKLINNDLEVTYFYDQALTQQVERITPLTAYVGPEMFSLRENLKQTVDIKRSGPNPNQVYVDGSRYGEILINDYLEAYIDSNLLQPGQTPDLLTRILKKERVADDIANGIQNQILLTCDAKIKIYGTDSMTTTFYKSIDNYVKTLKGILLNGVKMRADLLPDGTEERQNLILSQLAEGTPIFNGLINKDKISFRYLVDTFGLGLQENSKQVYLDLLYTRQDALGFINMPSAKDFRKSTNPSFINPDGSLSTAFIAAGGDDSKAPSFLYSFGKDYGQTYAGYFFPWLKINDNGRPTTIPPAMKAAEAYMRKYTANVSNLGSGSIIAGIDQGPITGILDVEMDFNYTDIENLNSMGANPIVYKMNLGFAIETENTAAVEPQTALSYLHVREILIELEKELRQMLLKYQWKFNTADTRSEIKFRADNICKKYQEKGYLYDFRNIMDETNNPLEVIDSGIGVLDTYVEVVRGMGILVNNVTILNTGDIASGRFSIL